MGSEVHQYVNKILLSEIYSKHYATIEFYKEHIKRKEIRATDITLGVLTMTYIVISKFILLYMYNYESNCLLSSDKQYINNRKNAASGREN